MKRTTAALLVITLVNAMNLIRYGFDWLNAFAVGLALVCIALDLRERWLLK